MSKYRKKFVVTDISISAGGKRLQRSGKVSDAESLRDCLEKIGGDEQDGRA